MFCAPLERAPFMHVLRMPFTQQLPPRFYLRLLNSCMGSTKFDGMRALLRYSNVAVPFGRYTKCRKHSPQDDDTRATETQRERERRIASLTKILMCLDHDKNGNVIPRWDSSTRIHTRDSEKIAVLDFRRGREHTVGVLSRFAYFQPKLL